MTDRRHLKPMPLGGEEGLPYSKGLMARALIATGVSASVRTSSRGASRPTSRARPRVHLDRAARGARRETLGGEEARSAGAGCAATRAPAARPADHPARRRRDRHGQVDGRDRGRLPARDHARHLDGLHPPDDARLLLAGVHALDPLLELRGGARRPDEEPRERGVPTASSSRRATCSSACAPRSTARSRRAGRWCSRASTSSRGWCRADRGGARRPVRRSRSRTRRSTAATS